MHTYYILQEQKLCNNIQKRGALYALQTICSHFGEHLQSKLPRLIEIVYNSIKNIKFPENDPSKFYEPLKIRICLFSLLGSINCYKSLIILN